MNTGAGEVSKVRQYTQVEGLSYTSIEVPYFDGFNDPSTNPPNIQSPWEGNIPIVGTDAGANQVKKTKPTHTNHKKQYSVVIMCMMVFSFY